MCKFEMACLFEYAGTPTAFFSSRVSVAPSRVGLGGANGASMLDESSRFAKAGDLSKSKCMIALAFETLPSLQLGDRQHVPFV